MNVKDAVIAAHQIQTLRTKRPNFQAKLLREEFTALNWIVTSRPFSLFPNQEINITQPGNWLNNYNVQLGVVSKILEALPRIKEQADSLVHTPLQKTSETISTALISIQSNPKNTTIMQPQDNPDS